MQDASDNLTNNGDNSGEDSDSSNDSSQPSGQPTPEAPVVNETLPNESQFEDPIASPNVTGEEDASGDAPGGEPVDIDEQLQKVGLTADSSEES